MPHCKKCGEANPDNFYASCVTECKECVKKRVRLNYRKNINHFVNYEKEREKTTERKKSKHLYMKKHRGMNPDKYKARNAVSNAIRAEAQTAKLTTATTANRWMLNGCAFFVIEQSMDKKPSKACH